MSLMFQFDAWNKVKGKQILFYPISIYPIGEFLSMCMSLKASSHRAWQSSSTRLLAWPQFVQTKYKGTESRS